MCSSVQFSSTESVPVHHWRKTLLENGQLLIQLPLLTQMMSYITFVVQPLQVCYNRDTSSYRLVPLKERMLSPKKYRYSNLLTPIKGKSHIPNYLQYRDRGFMYYLSEQFLPFLRAVDRNVRQYTNPDCFQCHGSQLVEVCTCIRMYVYIYVCVCSALMCVYICMLLMCVLKLYVCVSVCAAVLIFVQYNVHTIIRWFLTSLTFLFYLQITHRALQSNEEIKSVFVTFHHACHVINSFQCKQLMLFIQN